MVTLSAGVEAKLTTTEASPVPVEVDEVAQGAPVIELNIAPAGQPGVAVEVEQGAPVIELNIAPAGHPGVAVEVDVEDETALSLARVPAPTKPVADVRPAGVKISDAYFVWKAITAAFVFAPKY